MNGCFQRYGDVKWLITNGGTLHNGREGGRESLLPTGLPRLVSIQRAIFCLSVFVYLLICICSLIGWKWGEVKNQIAVMGFILLSGLAKILFHRAHWLSSRVSHKHLVKNSILEDFQTPFKIVSPSQLGMIYPSIKPREYFNSVPIVVEKDSIYCLGWAWSDLLLWKVHTMIELHRYLV